ncbi:MAG: (deoxy)nucleoside triphosphate pyrophosphohydrolase [Clostridia bacterium]|nr:(deoxy)nucleoside triphosphate pyrophosphohydrolase [Clostridia bacterium]
MTDTQNRKTVRVAAAAITSGGSVFATRRGHGKYKGFWEFPGGKIEPGETPEEALKREIREELATEIDVGEKIGTVEYDYPEFHLQLHLFLCTVMRGELTLCEHDDAVWFDPKHPDGLQWLPADLSLLPLIAGAVERADDPQK